MAESPVWEQVGASFVLLYYRHFDADRGQLGALYTEASRLSWEGELFHGREAIVKKLLNIPFQNIRHFITSQDHQPAPDNCILSMVVGKLKVDEELAMEFHQSFVLKNINDKWICINVPKDNPGDDKMRKSKIEDVQGIIVQTLKFK